MADENITIKVKSVSLEGSGDGGYKKVTATTGLVMSAWPTIKASGKDESKPNPGYDLINAGAILDVTIREQGKFKNIRNAKIHEGPFEEPKGPGGSGGNGDQDSPEKRRSIEAQQALINATNVAVARIGQGLDYADEKILVLAGHFRDFLGKPLSAKAETPVASEKKSELDEAFPPGEPPSNGMTWDRFYAIAKAMGYESTVACAKGLSPSYKSIKDWTGTKEEALDKLFERAKLEGRLSEVQSWKQIG